ADDQGRPVGSSSAAATLSFFPTKNLGGLGDGGAILTEDDALAARARLLRVHGDAGNYTHVALGTNARLDALQAAFLRTKLRHLPAWTEARRALAARYRRGLEGTPVGLPPNPDRARHTYHQFTIVAPRRDALASRLKERGIATRVYYPLTVPAQPCFRSLGLSPGSFPVSERLTREVLSLPIYPGLAADQVDRVAREIRAFYEETPAGAGAEGGS
ncbi:MAG TPA: DegT/DnrJ/EryC1/StrS family aminotransferase, partial [Candidatus Binatia bacterium]|nr:DegT/DnrJ/EryC1/StrS family aminotransferase [Candidatus Binatia bacterium]